MSFFYLFRCNEHNTSFGNQTRCGQNFIAIITDIIQYHWIFPSALSASAESARPRNLPWLDICSSAFSQVLVLMVIIVDNSRIMIIITSIIITIKSCIFLLYQLCFSFSPQSPWSGNCHWTGQQKLEERPSASHWGAEGSERATYGWLSGLPACCLCSAPNTSSQQPRRAHDTGWSVGGFPLPRIGNYNHLYFMMTLFHHWKRFNSIHNDG